MFVPPRSLPITTSGKVRRKASLELYQAGQLRRVEEP
jgi:acyl-CoA synthetase (AMP-forming)/AMP-acid ligase II